MVITRKLTRTVTGLVLLAALAACGNEDKAGKTRPPSSGDLHQTYVVTGVTEKGEPKDLVKGTEIRLRFADSRLTVTAGCNTMSGRYTLDGTRLTVEPMSMTEMGCDQARMDQDTWIAGLFEKPVQFTDGGDGVVISGETVLAIADRETVSPDKPLRGTAWVLDTLIDGDAASSVPAGVVAYLQIAGTSAGVYDGCNAGSSPVAITADRLVFGDWTQTLRGCTGSGVEEVQEAIHAVLDGGVGYEIDENTLTITKGDRSLGFRAVAKLPPHD